MNIKEQIVKSIGFNFAELNVNVEELIIESISEDKGDYSLPCFSFAKVLRDNPMNIANKIKDSVKLGGLVEKCEVVAGYLNFFLNKEFVSKEIVENFSSENFKYNEGQQKVVCIDYCSVNLAKYMHIGHIKNSFLGESLARLFENAGYKVVRINYIGDYGTPYGKIIAGINLFGSEEDIQNRGIDALQEYYVKFNAAEAEDEKLQQLARDVSKKIEDKDEEIYPIYQKVIDIARKEAERLLDILDIHFDSWKGEASYAPDLEKVVDILNEKGLISISQGATIVDLSDFDMPPCLIKRSDGASIYASRDIAAAIDRYETYKFDKCLYLTAVEQKLHFAQFFKVLELAKMPFSGGLEHIAYGRFSLPEGKISSRRGKQAILVDLLEYVLNKANTVIQDRTFSIENPSDVAQKVAKAVLAFNALNIERHKDAIFDIERAFSFDGETAPYMQYTFTRLESILRKYEDVDVVADYSCLNQEAFDILKSINNFNGVIKYALEKRDPSLILKRVMELCKMFNKFYTTSKVLDGNDKTTKAKINLVKALKDTLAVGFNLLCIDTLREM
ncbi:MAG: arginine--tRNA ligase [Clostridia bacterium]|nr:arginine--tRNA ligase [Clostridia bacterium]